MEYLSKINQQVVIMILKNKIQQQLTHQKTHLTTLDNKTIKQIQQKYRTKTKQTTQLKSQSQSE